MNFCFDSDPAEKKIIDILSVDDPLLVSRINLTSAARHGVT
jgi:hypothetical protein